MESTALERVQSLLEKGSVDAARKVLEEILRENPKDIKAWSLYVKSWKEPEKRIQALELCLKYNPGNADAERALANLKASLKSPPPVPASGQTSRPIKPAQEPVTSDAQRMGAQASTSPNEPSKPDRSAVQGETPKPTWMMDFSTPSASNPALSSAAGRISNEEIDRQAREMVEKRQIVGAPMAWYEVWYTALSEPNVDAYARLRANPYNLPSRIYLWLILAGLFSGIIAVIALKFNPQLGQVTGQMEQISPNLAQMFFVYTLCLIPFSGLMTLIGTAIRAGIQHAVAVMMGGRGTYLDLLYLMAAYSAPLLLASSVLGAIPLLNCLTPALQVYSIYLNAQALQAAHDLNGGKAFTIIIGIGVLYIIFICMVFYAVLSYVSTLSPSQPLY